MNLIKKNKNIKLLVLLVINMSFFSCSTKKNNFFSRNYHQTTTKYNGYFNGNESLKSGIRKLEENHKDDFTEIIPIFKTGDISKNKNIHPYMNKAIEKGSIVIQRHSMSIKGKERNKWIDDNYFMIGQAYFYKGEYDEAIKTFNYIKETYKKHKIKHNASLWLARCFSEKGDYVAAEMELDVIQADRRFPEKLSGQLALILADYYLKQENYILTLDELNTACKLIKRKKEKTRLYFIIAQINQKHKNFKKANSYYQKVIKANPDYEMVFNCKINKAQCVPANSEQSIKVRGELLKMTKDDKNKEYLDQIYYAIAKMDLLKEDSVLAIENFKISAQKSLFNDSQKTRSFLELAKIFYEQGNYIIASSFYDSTITFMEIDHEQYYQIKEKQTMLAELASYHNTITIEDSLQKLATLPETELNNIINQLIAAEHQKEIAKQQEKRLRENQRFESGRYGGREKNFGEKTSGGRWYFYNPATLSFGYSEFIKQWGKRKNEDDWRRSDKKISNEIANDSLNQTENNKVVRKSTNKKEPEYYMDRIPLTKEKLKNSNLLIMEAYFQAGTIYKSYLNENKKAINLFTTLSDRYPKNNNYTPLTLFNLHTIYTELDKYNKAAKFKQELLTTFPQSRYSKMLNDTSYLAKIEGEKQRSLEHYASTLELYNNQNFHKVIMECDSAFIINTNKELRPKYDLLKALAIGKVDNTNFKEQLQKISKKYPDSEVKIKAEEIISLLDNPEKMIKINQEIERGTPYVFDKDEEHYFIIITPKKDTDVNFIKTLLSDYHSNKYSIETFEISAVIFGKDQHLIMVKTFDGYKRAAAYYNTFTNASKVNNELLKNQNKKLLISVSNFKYFFKNQDLEKYDKFFSNNYFKEAFN
tara:strand:- start:27102 stop:29720 length:2619 start_codon:yes stop_codon:yes gene_type:complete